jgi:amino acid adenylation domain-containing protein
MAEEAFVFPLSFAQQRLWFLDQLEPGSSFYNIFDTLSFDEPLNVRALEESLNEIVRRHEVLRTTFANVRGKPVQVIAPRLTLPLHAVDLRRLSEEERDAETTRLSAEEYERPFELSRGPLVRAKLLRLADEENVLLLTMHHIVSDGWSLGILSREIRTLYEAYSTGRPSPLPDLPIQYADFTVWQREWLQGEVLGAQLDYWEKQLAGASSVMKLPTDRVRPAVQNFQQGANQWLKLPKPLAESLRALSQREGATLFMTLLAAFNLLLHRYTHQKDIVLGTPIAGRNRAETEGLIGFFVNTLVMRTDLSGDPSFRELLGRVKEVALGAYAHQDLPFEKLVEAISPERSLSHHPIFQVMFQLITAQSPVEEEESDASDDESSDAEEFEVVEGTAKFDIGLDIFESNGTLTAAVEYSTDLFDHTTIRRTLLHLRNLLESIAASPDTQISKLSFLTAAEREQILWQWNSTRSEYAEESCVHHLFEAQVERTPDAIAVVAEGEQLTYAELNERANRLAHYLRRQGVGPEVLVGICMERSVLMLVGLLGILKAGGAYVPLDPAYPKQRLAFMLEDARASVLLTEERLLSSLPEHSARIVCLDRDWGQIKLESETNLPVGAQPLNLAYVIYTSGSTGTPKGVMIQHRSLLNWTTRAQVEYALRPDDRILQFSSISFDTAAEEIYPCLTLGATLVLRSDAMASSIAKLLEKSREWKITVLDLPTAFWHELTWELATQNLKLPPSVRLVITGGEKALPERLSMWHRSVRGDVRLMQGYGPTEVTVVATIADLSKYRIAETALKEVPIGRAIGNAQVFILDEHQQPVPVGVAGELYIGGDGLARGYLNSASLTAERFIPNPFSQSEGARLYRTGDIARYLSDGEIEFVGRLDEQVKIRGYRIELGEIEALLRNYKEVRDAVVLAREDIPDDRRLVAYVVADQSNGFSVSELRRSLGDALPDYMVPSSFVLLEELPLTPNGKVNRRALPEPSPLHQEAVNIYVPPRTEMERIIAAIWQEVFRAEKLSVHSNFFDLGGHSLTLVRVHSMLHDRLHKEISMLDMFRYPTISSLSDYLSREQVVRTEVEPPRYQQIYDRALKQKDALSRRKQAMQQRAMTNE